MASEVTAVIEEVTKTEMKSAKTGNTFTAVHIKANGQTFSGYESNLPDGGVLAGDKVSIKSQPVTKADGSVFNKLISLDKVGNTETTTQSTFTKKTFNKGTFNKSKPANSPDYETSRNKDRQGQRLGMAVNNAVAIAIHNAAMERTSVSLDTIEGLAQELVQISERLEK